MLHDASSIFFVSCALRGLRLCRLRSMSVLTAMSLSAERKREKRERREERRGKEKKQKTEEWKGREGKGRERRKERKRGKSGQGSAPRLRGSRCVSRVTPRCPADRPFPTLPQLLRLACTRPRNQPDGSNKGLLVTSPRMTPTWAWARRPELPVTLGACEDATFPKEV